VRHWAAGASVRVSSDATRVRACAPMSESQDVVGVLHTASIYPRYAKRLSDRDRASVRVFDTGVRLNRLAVPESVLRSSFQR
jgi:hypothetical protein